MNANKESLYICLRDARRKAGMTQASLAKQADCKQSAISMMEQGGTNILARETINRIAEILQVDISAYAEEDSAQSAVRIVLKYCPVYDCPSNMPYTVGGRVFFLPEMEKCQTNKIQHCQMCGEILEEKCPECGAKVRDGACCELCGASFVSMPDGLTDSPVEWAEEQSARIRLL